MCILVYLLYIFFPQRNFLHCNVLFVLADSPRVSVRMQIQIGPKTNYSNAKTFRHRIVYRPEPYNSVLHTTHVCFSYADRLCVYRNEKHL